MSYYSVVRQTPQGRRNTTILSFVIAAVCFIAGIFQFINYKRVTNACTESVTATVVDVDSKRVRSRRSSHMEYRATVECEKNEAGLSSVTSRYTRYKFDYGDTVQVYYDPNDTSTRYIEHAEPENGFALFVLTGILLVIGVVYVVRRKP